MKGTEPAICYVCQQPAASNTALRALPLVLLPSALAAPEGLQGLPGVLACSDQRPDPRDILAMLDRNAAERSRQQS